jgi:superfamily II DNA or RNA helicase/HKD family nuclease
MNFYDSLLYGFQDSENYNRGMLSPRLITNNIESNDLMKNVLRSSLSTCDEYLFNVAFVTNQGLAQIRGILVDLDERNIKGKIIVSSYQYFTEPLALSHLMKLKNAEVRLIRSFDSHAKCYMVSKNHYHDIIVGSSNLTLHALTKSNEWNLHVVSSSKGDIFHQLNREFNHTWRNAEPLTESIINWYSGLYINNRSQRPKLKDPTIPYGSKERIVPNSMQEKALTNLEKLRKTGATRALIISATGTGKTYLSAFDVQKFRPKKFLFIVHRRTIAKAAMETFRSLLSESVTMGLYSGEHVERENDYLFATIQTLSREDHLKKFKPDEFDYIVIDESHRSGAESYQLIIDYFKPKFLLGMTATPERTDTFDIFKLFHNNVAHEIRLNQAMKDDLLCDFHYYGITDIEIDNKQGDLREFTELNYQRQAQHVLEKVKYFGADSKTVRGLVFCSTINHSKALAKYFQINGYRVAVLDNETHIDDREKLFDRLESDDENTKLDYLFSVDVLNEGVDIPKVNQVVMVRPTQSAIVFVQQLGRGLRKAENKEFLTVLDFIGNYKDKNFLIPVALFGDRSFNKDKLRRLMVNMDQYTPLSSTINFDAIAKEKIFKSIDETKLDQKRFLDSDYAYLKRKIGRIPLMCDFLKEEERDPFTFVTYSKSYARYLINQEKSLPKLDENKLKILDYLNMEVNNGKRVLESAILQYVSQKGHFNREDLIEISNQFGVHYSEIDFQSALNNLEFKFNKNYKLEKSIIQTDGDVVSWSSEFASYILTDEFFKELLIDNIQFGLEYFIRNRNETTTDVGFGLYSKYSRKDFSRIANLEANEEAVIFGYKIYPHIIPLFVTLKKDLNISKATQYEDYFIDPKHFHWMSKHSRDLNSKDIKAFLENNYDNRPVVLFIQKSKLENDFYFMGRLRPALDFENFIEGKIDKKGVVQITWELQHECPANLYQYFNAFLG